MRTTAYLARGVIFACFTAFALPVNARILVSNLDNNLRIAHVEIEGEISKADAADFRAIIEDITRILGESEAIIIVRLDSRGGDVNAAMAIGDLIRKKWIWTSVPDQAGDQCASACVLVLAAGAVRIAGDSSKVFVHRPRFDERVFAAMGREEAKTKYNEMAHQVADYLSRMGMSEQLFIEMMRVPSNEFRRLTYGEMEDFGLIGEDPGYQEWTRAKAVIRFGESDLKIWQDWKERSSIHFHNCVTSGRELHECAMETDRLYPNPVHGQKEDLDPPGLKPVDPQR